MMRSLRRREKMSSVIVERGFSSMSGGDIFLYEMLIRELLRGCVVIRSDTYMCASLLPGKLV